MNTLSRVVPVALIAATALALPASASAGGFQMNSGNDWSKWSVKGFITPPPGYKNTYINKDRTIANFEHSFGKCLIRFGFSSGSTSSGGLSRPDLMASVNDWLGYYVNKGSLGRGHMLNPTGTVGGKALYRTGAWGVNRSQSGGSKDALVGYSFYVSNTTIKGIYILPMMGLQAVHSGCTSAQILGQAGVAKTAMASFNVA